MPSRDSPESPNTSDVKLDLYFLIAQFLKDGPCKEAGLTLIRELEQNGLLHQSLDWTGTSRPPDFSHSVSRFRDLPTDYLMRICERIGPVLNTLFPPPVPAQPSLCGLGRYSILRDDKKVSTTVWNTRAYSASIGGNPLVPPHNFSKSHNWAYGIFGRENGGSRFKNLLRPIRSLYGQMKLYQRILGHLSSVYCVLFDRTGNRIFTGSDDCLIKSWSSSQGRLLATFRGHQSEICDMDICYENTILASASCDKEIRIWDARNGKPITILQAHTAMITSVEFSPVVQGLTRYLITTGRDGNVVFWVWNVRTLEFESQPHKFQERNRPGVAMLCSSCSSGGRFIAVGGSDNLVHIYHIPYEHDGSATIGPLTIAEQDEHTNTVDSIWFSNNGLRLVSGSKDGTARIWTYEYSIWTSLVLDVSRTFDSPLDPVLRTSNPNHPSTSKPSSSSKSQGKDASNKICVIMVAWDFCDENVMTSLTNFTIKVWNSVTRRLVSILKGHTDEAFCLEPHPSDKRVLLSAGHDGNVFLWDIVTGSSLMHFHNMLEGLGHGAVFDAKFSRDGNSFACTDSHGHLLVFGFGDGKAYHKCPVQQFFHTDYRPLIRDQHGYVLDEQTQQAPHLMPPPFLVDMDGNPYPPELQRLVPGRESSNDSQLLPNLVVQQDDAYEVIDVENIPEDPQLPPRSALDERINEMLQVGDGSDDAQPIEDPPPFASPSSSVGLRREGDTAGVRQMHPNAPRSQVASVADIMALNQRVITPQFTVEEQIRRSAIRRNKGKAELQWYRREQKKRRPISQRRLSRDNAKEEARRGHSKMRCRVQPRFKEDPIEEELSDGDRYRQLRRRLAAIPRSHAHRYSTRSTAPRPRIPSTAESASEQPSFLGDVEELYASDMDETSANSSSGDDFSVKAKILRRSRRNERTNHRKESRRKPVESQIHLTNGLRRSQRQRKVPDRLKNSDDQDSSTQESEDDVPGDASSGFASPFVPPATGHNGSSKRRVKRRKMRKQRITSNVSSNVESSDGESKPTTSHAKSKVQVQLNGNTNTSEANTPSRTIKVESLCSTSLVSLECFRPADWIQRVTPCSFPYVPQIDDDVVYIRQGHENYVAQVLELHVWSIGDTELCYEKYPDIGYAEPCRVTSIEYKVGPPTLCEVQLHRINQKMSKKSSFMVCYHDMPNVVDFLILKDKYDASISKSWSQGECFRSIIDDSWWYGTVVSIKPISDRYPVSHFQEVCVIWEGDNVQPDYDYLSPWDMESMSSTVVTRSQNPVKCHARVDPQDLLDAVGYKMKVTDWGGHDDSDPDDVYIADFVKKKMLKECKRIAKGIKRLISNEEFEAFAKPVDLVTYPAYPLYVAFPTDLSTIRQRVENHYYRRSSAILWEAVLLERNAAAFNEPDSFIANKGKMLHEVLDFFVKDSSCRNIEVALLQVQGADDEEAADPSFTDGDSDDPGKIASSEPEIATDVEQEPGISEDQDSRDVSEYVTTAEEDEGSGDPVWIDECKKLLAEVMQAQDSRPFRQHSQKDEDDMEDGDVGDGDEDTVDLTMIEGRLLNSQYENPEQMGADVQKMFLSFKKSNPSREGRSMLARLSPLMKKRIDDIVTVWKKTQVVGTRKSSHRKTSIHNSVVKQEDSLTSRIQEHLEVSGVSAYPTRSMRKRTRRQQSYFAEHSSLLEAEISSNLNADEGVTNGTVEVSVQETKGEYEVTTSRGLKRPLSESDGGQGDASLSLRLRRKQRKLSPIRDYNEDSEDSSDTGGGNTVKTRRFSKNKPPSAGSDRHPDLVARHEDYSGIESNSNDEFEQEPSPSPPLRKSSRCRKPVAKYIDHDSGSDSEILKQIPAIVDVKLESPSPPGGYVVPKKSARFRNYTFAGDKTHPDSSAVTRNLRKVRRRRRISSHSNFSDSDDR